MHTSLIHLLLHTGNIYLEGFIFFLLNFTLYYKASWHGDLRKYINCF